MADETRKNIDPDPLERGKLLVDALLSEENERDVVLVAAAFLDKMLRQIIEAQITKEGFKKNCPKSDDNHGLYQKLLGGPASLFSSSWAKATACRVFGIIKQPEYKALNALREIRNKFAHSGFKIGLADKEVAKYIQVLREYLSVLDASFPTTDGSGYPCVWSFPLRRRGIFPDDVPSNVHVVIGAASSLQLALFESYCNVVGNEHPIRFFL